MRSEGFADLLSIVSSETDRFRPKELSAIAWSFARLRFSPAPLLDAIAAAAIAKRAEFGQQELATTAWAFARLAYVDAPLLEAISAASIARIAEFNSFDLSGTAWAFAKLRGSAYKPLLDAIAASSIQNIGDFNPQHLSNTAWAFSTLAYAHQPLLDAISAQSIARRPGRSGEPVVQMFRCQELANMAWSYSTLAVLDLPLMNALSAAAIARISDFIPVDLSITAWAFAALGVSDEPLFSAISSASIRRIPAFIPLDIANTSWAFAKSGVPDAPLFAALSSAALRRMGEFNCQVLPNTLWAYASLSFGDGPLLDAISAASIRIIGELLAPGLSATAWSLATLPRRDGPLLAAISAQAIRTIADFQTQSFANTAWAFATLVCRDQPLFDAISKAAIRTLTGEDPRGQAVGAVAIVHAFEVAGCLSKELLDAAAVCLAKDASSSDGPIVSLSSELEEACDGLAPRGALAEPRVMIVRPPLCVLMKPPGWTVSVYSTEDGSSDINEIDSLLERDGAAASSGLETWLAAKFGPRFPISLDAGLSHGLLHRLDRDTSGALLWAASYSGFHAANLQFATRRVRKEYVCLCYGPAPLAQRTLQAPLLERARAELGGGPPRCLVDFERGRRACTELLVAEGLVSPEGDQLCLVRVRLHTGRQHQIRAHLSHEGRPLVGDTLYGGPTPAWCSRIFLHACRLALDIGEGPLDLQVPLPQDLRSALEALAPVDQHSVALQREWLESAG